MCHFLNCVFYHLDDRHRVKLHSLLADPNSDYVNANYIDVSFSVISLFYRLLSSPPLVTDIEVPQ